MYLGEISANSFLVDKIEFGLPKVLYVQKNCDVYIP